MAGVQISYAGGGVGKQLSIAVNRFGCGVAAICQQGKAQITPGAGQVVNLQPVDLFLQVCV